MSSFGTPTNFVMLNDPMAMYSPMASTMAPATGFSGLPAQGASSTAAAEAIGAAGMVISIFGAINSAIGTYYAAESQKNQLKMQAANQRFQSQMSEINARGAEFAAQQTLLAGAKEMGRVGMAMGQRRASAVAGLAARGGQLGVGSTREVVASMDIVSDIDRLTMDANRVRAAEAQRMQAVNYQTQAVMSGVSASNLYGTAGTISPGLGAFTSLLGSGQSLASTWAQNRRFEDMLLAMQEKRF
jgi:hypothetical protein